MSAPVVSHCYRHPNREALIRCIRCDRPICPDCMRQASVGFLCPDDAGSPGSSRSKTAPRSSLGLVLRDKRPYVTGTLVALNIAAYLATAIPSPRGLNQPEYSRLFGDWQLVPFLVYQQHQYFRLLTSAFLHAGLLHIGVNMLSLIFVGPYLERQLGAWRYVTVYLLSALGGSAAVYAFGEPFQAVIGASGAIFGLLGTCLVLVRQLGLDLQWLIWMIVLNFFLTFSVAGISKLGHIGGFVAGALCGFALGGLPRHRRRIPLQGQLIGLLGVLLVVAAVVGARTTVGVP